MSYARLRILAGFIAFALLGGVAWASEPSMFDEGRASAAFAAIRQQIGHDPRVLTLTIQADELSATVANDDAPGETIQWRVSNRGWLNALGVDLPTHEPSQRAMLTGSGAIADYLVSVDAESLAQIPRFAAAALAKARLQTPGRVVEMELRRLPKIVEPGARDPGWLVHVEGVEEEADITVNPDGQIAFADLSRTKRAQNLDLLAGGDDFNERLQDIRDQMKDKWAFHYIEIEKTSIGLDVRLKSVKNPAVTRFTANLEGIRTSSLSMPHIAFPDDPTDDPFELADVDFGSMTKFEALAKARLAIADGVVQRVIVSKPHRENGGAIEWQVDIRSAHAPLFVMPGQPPVEEGSVAFDAKGEIVRTKFPPGKGPKIDLLAPDALQKAIDKIVLRLGPKIQLSELRVDADSVEVTAQDPQAPRQLAVFAYRDGDVARMSGAKQVVANAMGNAMGSATEGLWSVGLLTPAVVDSLAGLEKQALSRIAIANGAVERIVISKDRIFHPGNDKVLIEIFVAGPGPAAPSDSVTFDLSGAAPNLAAPVSGLRVVGGASGESPTDQDEQDCTHSLDPDVVIPACTKLAEDTSDTPHNRAVAYYDRGNAYKTRKDYDTAIADYSEALKLNPAYAHALLNRGYCYAAKNDAQDALADLNRAVQLDPKEPLGYAGRALVYNAMRNYDAAIADYDKVVALGAAQDATYYQRGLAEAYKGDLAKATADYNEALRRNPRLGAAFLARGTAERAQNKFDAALADYNSAIALAPDAPDAYRQRGVVEQHRGDFDRAIADFSAAIQRAPQWATAYSDRGAAHGDKGEFDLAVKDHDQAISIDPKSGFFYYRRGYVHLLQGAAPSALADLTEANALSPADAYSALLLDSVGQRSGLPPRLAELSGKLDMTAWPAPVVRLYLGQLTPEAVLAAAEDRDPVRKQGKLCEANYYIGDWQLRAGRRDEATNRFLSASRDCETTWSEWELANGALKALGVPLPARAR